MRYREKGTHNRIVDVYCKDDTYRFVEQEDGVVFHGVRKATGRILDPNEGWVTDPHKMTDHQIKMAITEAREDAIKALARWTLDDEQARKDAHNKNVATAIGIIAFVVAMFGGLSIIDGGLWGLLVAGAGFIVAVVCLLYVKSFDSQLYQPHQTSQPSRYKYMWEMSDDEKNAMLLGRLQNEYMHHKDK